MEASIRSFGKGSRKLKLSRKGFQFTQRQLANAPSPQEKYFCARKGDLSSTRDGVRKGDERQCSITCLTKLVGSSSCRS